MNLQNQGIAVFCASSSGVAPHHMDTAAALGQEIGRRGGVIVYGGATIGLMGQVANAAMAAGGRVFGVIPQLLVDKEVAHKGIQELVVVDTMHQRKALMSERAAAYVILPGGFGTYEEFFEVVTWKQLGMHRKPIIVVNVAGFYDPLLAQVERALDEGLIRPAYRDLFAVATDVTHLMQLLDHAPEPDMAEETWF